MAPKTMDVIVEMKRNGNPFMEASHERAVGWMNHCNACVMCTMSLNKYLCLGMSHSLQSKSNRSRILRRTIVLLVHFDPIELSKWNRIKWSWISRHCPNSPCVCGRNVIVNSRLESNQGADRREQWYSNVFEDNRFEPFCGKWFWHIDFLKHIIMRLIEMETWTIYSERKRWIRITLPPLSQHFVGLK